MCLSRGKSVQPFFQRAIFSSSPRQVEFAVSFCHNTQQFCRQIYRTELSGLEDENKFSNCVPRTVWFLFLI
jgi:hypothetical protein